MKSSIYVPSHITGFFNIKDNSNPLLKGSCGVGFLLNKGVETTIKKSPKDKIAIKINGKKDKYNEGIIKEVLRLLDINHGIKITQKIEVPIGCGFGSSASSALGVSIATSKLLDLNNDLIKSGQIAHLAEVNLGSGLGDVIAEMSKGIVERVIPGSPGYGKTKIIQNTEEIYVGVKTFSKIKTSDIIENEDHKNRINLIGKELLNDFNLNPTISKFLDNSLKFSIKTNLINEKVLKAVTEFNELEDILGSSMAMLGNTVFAMTYNKETFESLEDIKIYKIDNEGIKL
ncbi:GHMP kinase [Methanobrevibacter sp. OttesenSCG-928-K11]|nr:GHMP kinase [Methanobrevibacter sp. OttesenSCG-928-K11]MDL2270536.1 GHMP kinase [Methanobrevibacter sp. OttesenSCG-928-I08]